MGRGGLWNGLFEAFRGMEYRHGSFVRAVRPRWGRLGW